MDRTKKKAKSYSQTTKMGSNSAARIGPGDSEAERRKKIEEQLRQRVDLEEKAFRIVERMLDNPVSEDFFLESVLHIQPSHYDDIVEERAIAMMCGYPVCPKSLTNVPKQKYHISTKSNRVYDISTRKNFCSNKCFEASEYLKGQLMTSPLWMREEEPKPKIQLLSLDSTRGSVGHEVITSSVAMKKELEALERRDKYEQRLKVKQTLHSDSRSDPDQLDIEGLTLQEKDSNQTSSDVENRLHDTTKSLSGAESKTIGILGNDASEHVDLDENISRSFPKSENSNKSVIEETCDKEEKSNITEHETSNSPEKCDLHNSSNVETSLDTDKQESSQKSKQDITHAEQTQTKAPQPKLEQMSSQNKVDYLMKLLDKRKHLLSKMADIQPTNVHPVDTQTIPVNCDSSVSSNEVVIPSSQQTHHAEELHLKEERKTNQSNQTHATAQSLSRVEVKDQELEHMKVNEDIDKSPAQKSTCSPGFLMCQCLKQWITKETKQYLQKDIDKNSSVLSDKERHQFEEQYKELCHRVDAKENDLDAMIDETGMDDSSMSCKPLPHYRELKAETEEFNKKVEQFMQGKLVMEKAVKEKGEDEKTPVYLPIVDTYDQLLIRRKIVMDKLNKAMPELLSPLNLSVQSIFTDLKNLIATFSFSNQNILFKPAQWTLISIFLLKILARKHLHIAAAFDQPSAKNYFQVLLGGIGETTQTMSVYVDDLLNKK